MANGPCFHLVYVPRHACGAGLVGEANVFPALRTGLEPFRVQLVDVDLRWGVTQEQSDNDQALDVCLQQIDECRPFFVGILGERYGWGSHKA